MAKQPINSFVGKYLGNTTEVENEIENDVENTLLENHNSPLILKNAPKGDKNSTFVQNCVLSFKNSEFNNNEKATLNVNRGINNKLKVLGIASNVTISDLSNAIIYEYFETHKKEIAVLMKKIQM